MSLTVNTNTTALSSLNYLSQANRRLSKSFGRLSSGLRITSAADDAAGLGVAENLNAQARSARQAVRNVNDGISVLQTAEGATEEVTNIIKRMRELAVQSASETLANAERTYINDEYSTLASEIDRIASVTEFNGVSLANTTSSIEVQVGTMNTSNDRIAIQLGNFEISNLGIDTGTVTLSNVAAAQSAITALDSALQSVTSVRAGFGATQNRLESALNNLETYTENLTTAESRIRDADFAYETAQLSRNQIIQQAGVSILAQANQLGQSALQLIN